MDNSIREKKSKYYLNSIGEFVIENYNFSKPLANFFPGIAGPYGIPMWVFYVNRGQAMISFGTKDKDHSILEFLPANKAWQLVPLQGFRTFIKLFNANKVTFYEPFHNGFANLGFSLTNKMFITPYELKIEEENFSLGLKIKIEYFTIPNDSYAALARIVTIKNTGNAKKSIELLDGLPQIVPYGIANLFLKKLSRTIEAWMGVKNLDKGVPFYKTNVDPIDRPWVIHIKGGNFYLGFYYEKGRPQIIKPIVDPQCIFGPVTDFSCPRQFLSQRKFKLSTKEITESKMPCAFLPLDLKLPAGQEKIFYSLIGNMRSLEILNTSVPRIISPEYLPAKRHENKAIIEKLQSDINTVSSLKEFDLYAKQTYLDNIMRGGYPKIFNSKKGPVVFYLYSRKHGDLERDYNKFELEPTYFSQGNGNYRDINQNRRNDIWFNPEIGSENISTFFNLIQTDGFNPLVLKNANFIIKNASGLKNALKDLVVDKDIPALLSFLCNPFTPGELIFFIEERRINLKISHDGFLNAVISFCAKNQEAKHGEGFWIDHWTYNLDLLESFLGVYPEKLKEILFDKKTFTYYDNTEVVQPRSQKYILENGAVRQLHSVVSDATKKEMIEKRMLQQNVMRTQHGRGGIYTTTLMNKLLCIIANKISSLDPFGVGIEMEANKPSWFDALNGLPGLFGSSLNETLELERLIFFIKKAFDETKAEQILVSEEIHNFLISLAKLLGEYFTSKSTNRDYRYWDKSYRLKEEYRKNTKLGFSGRELKITSSKVITILENALKKLDVGIYKALDKKKDIYCAYFINEVSEYKILKGSFVTPTKFVQKRLPFFLEGQFHALRLVDDLNKVKKLHRAVKNSALYDKKLKMYKITASLKGCPEEIGRCRAFTPGWLERESIWLHAEYKYVLEILKHGLYKEFYEDFKNILVPFQDPQRYGRSILENSSFIVSSVFPDKSLHGNGFVARLSGSTAEFLQMWLVMNLGSKPFILNSRNELNLRFSPALAGWLFTRNDKTYSFNFLSTIRVVYHNPKRKDTFGKNAVRPSRILFNDRHGNQREFFSDTIPSPYAEQVRNRRINHIDVYFE